MNGWECSCPMCMGTLEPPDNEPTEAELEAMERDQRTNSEPDVQDR